MQTPPRPYVFLLLGFLSLLVARPAGAVVYISEFMADNQLGIVDEDGDHPDWLELYNDGDAAVSLNGWYLTDEAQSDLRKWRFPVTTPAISLAAKGRLRVWVSNKNRKAAADRLHTNFRLNNSGEHLALVRPDGFTIEHGYAPYPQQVQDIAYGLVGTEWQQLVAEHAPGKATVPLSAADMPAGWNGNAPFDDSTWQAGQSGFGYDTADTYGDLIGPGGDLKSTMHNGATNTPVNTTALVRIPFQVQNKAAIASLRLLMKYDDGFICYLNGTLLAQNSVPLTPTWDSAATQNRSSGITSVFEVYTPPGTALGSLVEGTNVLAVHVLNHALEDTDTQGTPNGWRTLGLPVLEGNVTTGVLTPAYLASPTPGAVNSGRLGALGPLITGTTRSNDVPRPTGVTGSAPLVISAKVLPTLNPLNAADPVQLKFQTMYSSEQTASMRDNGIAPDTAAGDGIYTAQIPTAVGVGRMIRWRVLARDNAATPVTSTDPPFRDPTDNEQYYGTVTQDGINTSLLPVMHWFAANPAAGRTEGGSRCSIFFLGDFYDNVAVNLHGQSSSGFPVDKKSQDFNFNEDNRFKWKNGEARQRAINLITTWADKSKVRDTLSWETWAAARHRASHWAQLVRVQQNGAFWGVYDMVENGDEDFLSRTGLDPNSSLYKLYDRMIDVANAEKKTGAPISDKTDIRSLYTNLEYESTNGLPVVPLSLRRQYAYDNVDIPSLVNSLAVNALINNNDSGHKNFYLYRDTKHTGEWSLLPWDQDLSLGHTWVSGPNYFDDEIDSQRGIRNGATNKIKQLLYDSPEINAMLVRRLRSLMDQFLVSPTATDGPMEQRLNDLLSSVDPNNDSAATGVDDADLDMRRWGFWVHNGGGNPIPFTDPRMPIHTARAMAGRILNSNPNDNTLNYNQYPGTSSGSPQGNNTTFAYFPGRRAFLYSSAALSGSLGVPAAQPVEPKGLTIEQIDPNPASGNNEQEFFVIKNTTGQYVDVSGWKITGAVNHTFFGGTVIAPFTSGFENLGYLHVARNPRQFRQRTSGPKAREYRLVVGPYDGRLSARGGTIELRNLANTVVASSSYAAAPTASQSALRVTELHFAPPPATAAELAALPGLQTGDFEFIELTNTGSTELSLANAQFDKGITFVFPAGFTLAPGARTVVVSSPAAFQARYGTSANIAGQFEGSLDNAGEEVRLLDPVGEEVLRLTYDPRWYSDAVGAGASLVTRSSTPQFDGYDVATAWQVSRALGGSPGTAEPAVLATPGQTTVTKGPIAVAFTLPEPAVPESLKLSFDDGVAPQVFTLAPSQETAGEHNFTFDPGNPTASGAIINGSALADGTYAVRITYQDATANPTVASASANLILDRVAPTLTVPADLVAEATSAAGATVSYPHATAADPSGVASVSYSHASGSTFTPGVTTVAVAATDNAGNVASGTFTVTVRDTVAPQITDAPANRTVTPGTNGTASLPDLTGEVIATDAVGVAGVTQSPAPGTALNSGTHLITFTVSDTAGNIATITSTVEVRPGRPSAQQTVVVEGTGSAAPGPGSPDGPPAGTRVVGFGTPAISDERDLAARATLQHGRSRRDSIFFEDGSGVAQLIAFEGSATPDVPSTVFKSFGDPVLSPGGSIAFAATIAASAGAEAIAATADDGVWTTALGGGLRLALREGSAVPGIPDTVLAGVVSVSLRDGEMLASIRLLPGFGGVTEANDSALIRLSARGGTLLLREGDPFSLNDLPSTIHSISVLGPAPGSPGHGRWHGNREAVAKVTLAEGREVLVSLETAGVATVLLGSGDSAGNQAGPVWNGFGLPATDGENINIATRGTLLNGAGGVTSGDDDALAASFADEPFSLFAREGSPAPGASGTRFARFYDPLINDTGLVAFLATLDGRGVDKTNRTGIWWRNPSEPELLARLGGRTVDRAGRGTSQRWSSFLSLALPDGPGAGPILLARLGGRGVTRSNNLGCWAVDSAGKLRELFRTGQGVRVGGKVKQVAKISLLNSPRGVFGTTRSFNAAGSIALRATFTDKSEALLRIDVP